MSKWILAMLAILFLAGSVSAFDATTFERGISVESVTGLSGNWIDACAVFKWNATSDADFNHFVIQTSSNNSALNGFDINTSDNEYVFCTAQDSDWVKAVVYRVDGNSEGYFLNLEPDANATMNPGTMTQAGQYLAFNLMTAFGALIGLIIIVVVMIAVLSRMGIDVKWFS